LDIEYSSDRFGLSNRSLDLYNSYGKAPTSTYFYNNNEFTIIMWFNKYYGIDHHTYKLVLFDFSLDNSRNIGLEIIDNQIIFFAKNATGSIMTLESNYKINYKEWYHIAITYLNSSRLIYLYVNGILVSTHFIDLILGETNLNYIGRSDALNIIGSVVLIDEIRIYNRVLNSNEIIADSNDRPNTTTTTTTRATTTIDKCKYFDCLNGGTCYTGYYGDAKCNCTDDYNGDNCQGNYFFFKAPI